jgi:hypothetical protein
VPLGSPWVLLRRMLPSLLLLWLHLSEWSSSTLISTTSAKEIAVRLLQKPKCLFYIRLIIPEFSQIDLLVFYVNVDLIRRAATSCLEFQLLYIRTGISVTSITFVQILLRNVKMLWQGKIAIFSNRIFTCSWDWRSVTRSCSSFFSPLLLVFHLWFWNQTCWIISCVFSL